MKPAYKGCTIAFILACITLTSCYQEIDLEKYKKDPALVLNAVISNETNVLVSLSKTWFYSDENTSSVISDADVKLYINGNFAEQMLWDKNFYQSEITPQEGDRVRIEAECNSGKVSAEAIIPAKTEIKNASVSFLKSNWEGAVFGPNGYQVFSRTDVIYQIEFQDDPEAENYYLIRIEPEDGNITGGGDNFGSLEFSTDPIFIGERSVLEGISIEEGLWGQGGRTFLDKTINGQKYTLAIKEKGLNPYDKVLNRKIILYSLSKEYYQYLTALQSMYDETLLKNMAEIGLMEPRRIYSNVEGGIGILGACQQASYSVSFTLPKWD